jgi:TusA-related sulfurtransferase
MIEVLDVRGLKSPECLVKIALRAAHMNSGSILEVLADSPTFEEDVRAWCQETGRVLFSLESEGESTKIVQIQF